MHVSSMITHRGWFPQVSIMVYSGEITQIITIWLINDG